MRHYEPVPTTSSDSAKTALLASNAIVKATDPRASIPTLGGSVMNDATYAAAGGLLAKLLPAGLGAALMIAVDTPKTRREWFLRIFVAFACSWAFYGFTFDLLKSLSWFSFMEKHNEDHQFAVRTLLGATGWFLLGGASMLLNRFRVDPGAVIDDAKKVAP